MASSLPRKTGVQVVSGNLDTLVAGTVTGGNVLATNGVEPNSLSGEFTVEAETDTITITAIWQVSVDQVTWVDMPTQNNAANVVLATGTAGDDAIVTKAIPAPSAIWGYPFVRGAVQNGVATGAATDTFSIKYNYVSFSGFTRK